MDFRILLEILLVVLGYSPNKKMPVTSIITTIFFGIGPKKLHYPLELDGEISFIQKCLYNYVCIYTYIYLYIHIHVHISSNVYVLEANFYREFEWLSPLGPGPLLARKELKPLKPQKRIQPTQKLTYQY